MKKFLMTFLILCVSFFVSGCIRFDTEITIDKNGNATLCDKILISQQLFQYYGKSASDVDPRNFEYLKHMNANVQTTNINENGYEGFEFFENIKNLAKNDLLNLYSYFSPNAFINNHYRSIIINKNIYNSNYKININTDFASVKDFDGKKMFTRESADYITSKLTINIPTKAIASNATNITNNGLTHIWNFNTINNYNIQLEFNVINYFNIVLTVISLLLLITGYILKQNKYPKIVQKSLFYISSLIFTYFIVVQIIYCIQCFYISPYDIGVITIFVCLIISSIFLIIGNEKQSRFSNQNEKQKTLTDNISHTKTCEYCGGEVSDTAKKCKYCGEWLIPKSENSPINHTTQNTTQTKNKKIIDIFLRILLVCLIIFTFIIGVNKYGDEHFDTIYDPHYEQNIFLKFIHTIDTFFYLQKYTHGI